MRVVLFHLRRGEYGSLFSHLPSFDAFPRTSILAARGRRPFKISSRPRFFFDHHITFFAAQEAFLSRV
jgi:hypothetical protein